MDSYNERHPNPEQANYIVANRQLKSLLRLLVQLQPHNECLKTAKEDLFEKMKKLGPDSIFFAHGIVEHIQPREKAFFARDSAFFLQDKEISEKVSKNQFAISDIKDIWDDLIPMQQFAIWTDLHVLYSLSLKAVNYVDFT